VRPTWRWWLSCAVRLRELAREAVDMNDDLAMRDFNRRALAAFKDLQGDEVVCFDAWMASLHDGTDPLLKALKKGRRRAAASSSKAPKDPA